MRRLLLAVFVAMAFGLTSATAAAALRTAAPAVAALRTAAPAAPWDCKAAPSPAMPDAGLPGFFDPAPKPIPPAGDPFAANSSTTVYDQYGYAGLSWSTYDLGCMGGLGEMDATIDTFVGNMFISSGVWVSSATNGIHNRVARPAQYMAPLDDVVAQVTTRLNEAIWSPWGMVSILGVVVMLLFYSLHGRLSSVVSGAAWALLVLAILSGVSAYPTRVASFFDQAVTESIASVNQSSTGLGQNSGGDPTRAQGALIVDGVLYQAWLRGMFGDPNSAAAKKWGPVLFRESTFSRAELQTALAQPDGVKALTEQKANDWVATTAEIQAQDPLAYATVQGKAKGRAGSGFMSFIGVLFTGLFRLVADLFVFAGLVMLRLLVMFFPAAAVFGIIAPMSSIVRRVGNIAGASVINVVAFGVGSAIHTVVIAAILSRANSAGMGILTLVLCLVVTVAAFVLMMPLLSFTNILGHSSSRGHSMLRSARRTATGYVVGRKVVGSGLKDTGPQEDPGEDGSSGEEGTPSRDRGPARQVRPVSLPVETFGRPQLTASSHRVAPAGRRELASAPGVAELAAGPAARSPRSGQDHAAGSQPSVNRQGGASGIPTHDVYDPADRANLSPPKRVIVGVLVDELPREMRGISLTRVHDSHTEFRPDGVGPRLYDPATRETLMAGGRSEGRTHE